jgi:lysozyme
LPTEKGARMKYLISVILSLLIILPCSTQQVFNSKLDMHLTKVAHQYLVLSQIEGSRSNAYRDVKGLYTIGVGHLIKPHEKELKYKTLTQQEIIQLFKEDIKSCNDAIPDGLLPYQHDALLSFCFNIGVDNFKRSTVIRHIRDRNFHSAADAFLLWNKPAVLEDRRKKEREIFLGRAKIVAFMH